MVMGWEMGEQAVVKIDVCMHAKDVWITKHKDRREEVVVKIRWSPNNDLLQRKKKLQCVKMRWFPCMQLLYFIK